jgi:hypothetical protein
MLAHAAGQKPILDLGGGAADDAVLDNVFMLWDEES